MPEGEQGRQGGRQAGRMVGTLSFELQKYAKHRRYLKKILNNTKSSLHDIYRSGYFSSRKCFSAPAPRSASAPDLSCCWRRNPLVLPFESAALFRPRVPLIRRPACCLAIIWPSHGCQAWEVLFAARSLSRERERECCWLQ